MTVPPSITPGRYDPERQQWVPGTPRPDESSAVSELCVATLNVWFADHHFDERCAAILALLAAHSPDVIALQEVTPALLEHVRAAPWVRAAYHLSDVVGTSVDPYGVLVLSRLPIRDWQCVALSSDLGRDLIVARAVLHGQPIAFAAVHLESRSSAARIRAIQLGRVFEALEADPRVVLAGDFNFCSRWEENRRLDPTYQDVWSAIHPEEPGFTVDTDRNTMRLLATGKHKQVRYDRVLLRSSPPGWRAAAIELIGTAPVRAGAPDLFPSDHFGLLSRFVWQPAPRVA